MILVFFIFAGKMTNLQIHDTFEVEEKSELTTVVKDDIQGSLTLDYGIRYLHYREKLGLI